MKLKKNNGGFNDICHHNSGIFNFGIRSTNGIKRQNKQYHMQDPENAVLIWILNPIFLIIYTVQTQKTVHTL